MFYFLIFKSFVDLFGEKGIGDIGEIGEVF